MDESRVFVLKKLFLSSIVIPIDRFILHNYEGYITVIRSECSEGTVGADNQVGGSQYIKIMDGISAAYMR